MSSAQLRVKLRVLKHCDVRLGGRRLGGRFLARLHPQGYSCGIHESATLVPLRVHASRKAEVLESSSAESELCCGKSWQARRVLLLFVRVRPRQPKGCAGTSYEEALYGKLQHGGAAPSHSSGFRTRACCVQAFRQRPKDRRLHRYGDLHRLSVASCLGGLQLFWL